MNPEESAERLRGFAPKIMRVFRASVFLFPFFILSAGASSVSGTRFQESLRAYKTGDYRNAMLGFMDVVMAEPENEPARNYLSKAGRKALKMEEETIQLRRKNLLQDAETMKKRLVSMEESKEAKIREWNRLFLRAEELARSPDSLGEAVSVYEKFMDETPIYARLRREFSEKEKIIMGTFYETIKAGYPGITHGRTGIDEADLGSVFFMREALAYRHVGSGQTESILARSARIKNLRSSIGELFDDETRALDLYSRGKFAEADSFFRKVLKACGDNEEAAFYAELASARVAAESPPPPQPPCPDDLCRKPAVPASLSAVPEAAPHGGAVLRPSAFPKRTAVRGAKRNSLPYGGKKQVYANEPSAAAPQPAAAEALPSAAEVRGRAESGQAGGEAEADRLYEQGVREFSVGNYGAADKSWSECLRLNPEHTKAKLGVKRLKSAGGGN